MGSLKLFRVQLSRTFGFAFVLDWDFTTLIIIIPCFVFSINFTGEKWFDFYNGWK